MSNEARFWFPNIPSNRHLTIMHAFIHNIIQDIHRHWHDITIFLISIIYIAIYSDLCSVIYKFAKSENYGTEICSQEGNKNLKIQ